MFDVGTLKFSLLLPFLLYAASAVAQEGAAPPSPAPSEIVATEADAAADVPSPDAVLGYGIGERFTDHAHVVRYMEALAAASPRVELRRYGSTVEGRPLTQVIIASERNLAGLDEILARNRALSDPATSQAEAEAIASTNPSIVYFSYGVHGNESSSSEASMWTAWDLARGAERVAGVLDSVVVVIDPAVNPDGRDRYVDWYRRARAMPANPRPESREHDEPWPGGRYNHYLFDLNRDWAWLSQPETRARIATWSRWTPQVHVDFHEMSPRSTYFFFPATEPINPLYPDQIMKWGRYFGESNAAAFDEMGWLYYTAESFDLFYPGYGDSWPALSGAIGMTYEQAGGGGAGLAYERPDGTVLTLRDRAMHHRTSGLATARAAAARKTDLLRDFARFHREVDEGLPDILLVPGEDPTRAEALVSLLRSQGIRVERAERGFDAAATVHAGFEARHRFPAGTYLIRARQPRGRLALTLLQAETELDATFSYDISAWSLPYAYGVEAHRVENAPGSTEWAPVPADAEAGEPAVTAGQGDARTMAFADRSDAGAPYGYLVEPSLSAWPALVRYLDMDGRAIVLDEAFEAGGRSWPAGTVFLPRARTDALVGKVHGAGLGAFATPVRSGWTGVGRDLGTEYAYTLELPRIAVLMGDGISPTSYGAHWFFLERTLGMPFDAVPTSRLARTPLDEYDVLVIPEARGSAALGAGNVERVNEWVRQGGTLVAVGGGAEAVAEPIAEVQLREAAAEDGGSDADSALARALRGRDARELARWEARVPGTILPVRLDPAHPLAFGVGIGPGRDRMHVLHGGDLVFEPDDAFETVAHFPDSVDEVSGVIGEASLDRLSQGSWLVARRRGAGRVVLFADDPLFRHFWYSAFLPYVNAILIGPAL